MAVQGIWRVPRDRSTIGLWTVIPPARPRLDDAAASLARHGLSLRGTFNPADREAPPGPSGQPARSVLLIGNAGGAFWSHFDAWRRQQAADPANPLDAWTKTVVEPVAAAIGARAVYPFERPFQPFQQWAMRAEGLKPSPLGILLHPVYGPWHAYRAALLFDEAVAAPVAPAAAHPCDICATKPCMKACPVGAHADDGFDYRGCVGHLASGGDCMAGCFDRNACPVGTEHRYARALQAFLSDAFIRAAGTAAASTR